MLGLSQMWSTGLYLKSPDLECTIVLVWLVKWSKLKEHVCVRDWRKGLDCDSVIYEAAARFPFFSSAAPSTHIRTVAVSPPHTMWQKHQHHFHDYWWHNTATLWWFVAPTSSPSTWWPVTPTCSLHVFPVFLYSCHRDEKAPTVSDADEQHLNLMSCCCHVMVQNLYLKYFYPPPLWVYPLSGPTHLQHFTRATAVFIGRWLVTAVWERQTTCCSETDHCQSMWTDCCYISFRNHESV